MLLSEAYQWLKTRELHQVIVIGMKQPMTAKQLAVHIGSLDRCSYALWELSAYGFVKCLNPNALRSRLYWLTDLGGSCQRRLRNERGIDIACYDFKDVNWELYGWLCFNHRSAVVKALTEPMQPSMIKKRLLLMCPDIKISANNIRDIIKLFLGKGLVQIVKVKKKAHLRYELNDEGKKFRELIISAGAFGG